VAKPFYRDDGLVIKPAISVPFTLFFNLDDLPSLMGDEVVVRGL
jgi:hypothetical protein